tara:strand:- start:961 stop:1224 length:264 start_codon:yes stop_codon:yes gene_type:complete
MIETILIVTFACTTLISTYVVINLYIKCDALEQWVDSTYLNIQQTLQTMKDIDAEGHFQTDDEVEVVFKHLEETLNYMENIVEEKNA